MIGVQIGAQALVGNCLRLSLQQLGMTKMYKTVYKKKLDSRTYLKILYLLSLLRQLDLVDDYVWEIDEANDLLHILMWVDT
jgi:hypothetical protein